MDIEDIAVNILQGIQSLQDMRESIEANKNQSIRLIDRISGLTPLIEKIKSKDRFAEIGLGNKFFLLRLMTNMLQTIRRANKFLREFCAENGGWYNAVNNTVKQFTRRNEYADTFIELNAKITQYIGDVSFSETAHLADDADRQKDDEEFEEMFAKILDKLEGGKPQEQQAEIAKFRNIGVNINDVKTIIALETRAKVQDLL